MRIDGRSAWREAAEPKPFLAKKGCIMKTSSLGTSIVLLAVAFLVASCFAYTEPPFHSPGQSRIDAGHYPGLTWHPSGRSWYGHSSTRSWHAGNRSWYGHWARRSWHARPRSWRGHRGGRSWHARARSWRGHLARRSWRRHPRAVPTQPPRGHRAGRSWQRHPRAVPTKPPRGHRANVSRSGRQPGARRHTTRQSRATHRRAPPPKRDVRPHGSDDTGRPPRDAEPRRRGTERHRHVSGRSWR